MPFQQGHTIRQLGSAPIGQNEYRYRIYEGPHYIGREYVSVQSARPFVEKTGWYCVTVHGDRIVSIRDGDWKKLGHRVPDRLH